MFQMKHKNRQIISSLDVWKFENWEIIDTECFRFAKKWKIIQN